MNYIKPIAKVLNVKPGEEFKVTGYRDKIFRIGEHGLELKMAGKYWVDAPERVLHEIMMGRAEIVKLEVAP